MKVLQLFPILILLFLLTWNSSCKKEELPPQTTVSPPDYSHYNSNFYCLHQKEHHYIPSAVTYDTADVVIDLQVSNDSLIYKHLKTKIDSSTQTSFFLIYQFPPQLDSVFINFYNNFDSVSITHSNIDYHVEMNQSYNGTKTNLDLTGVDHYYHQDLQGNYQLQIKKIDPQNNIDTTYSTLLAVTNSTAGNVKLDNLTFSGISNFHSYSNRVLYDMSITKNNIYWKMDSLFIRHQQINFGSQSSDTLSYEYKGVKVN